VDPEPGCSPDLAIEWFLSFTPAMVSRDHIAIEGPGSADDIRPSPIVRRFSVALASSAHRAEDTRGTS
jgi:hypothetical protein